MADMSTVLPSVMLSQSNLTDESAASGSYYSLTQSALMIVVAGLLIIVTVFGNIMVMVSFHIDKQLQTISNYFLFSLAVADFAIGLISMPLFTVYQVMGKWVLGPVVCDTWLAIDYLASNASVLNLLIISFDRYFSVTRPLTYRVRRTNQRAAVMIASAWLISLALWPPWIFAWPYIEGKRTVEPEECYIQFIETNYYATFGTAIAAFYLPVVIMCGLYYRIWRETEQRKHDLTQLQALKRTPSKQSEESERYEKKAFGKRRKKYQRSSSEVRRVNTKIYHRMKLSVLLNNQQEAPSGAGRKSDCLSSCCSKNRSILSTPGTSETPLQGSVLSRWLSRSGTARLMQGSVGALNESRSPHCSSSNCGHPPLRHTKSDPASGSAPGGEWCSSSRADMPSPLPILRNLHHTTSGNLARPPRRSLSAESVYTIVIKLPEPSGLEQRHPSITMIGDSDSEHHQPHCPLSRASPCESRRLNNSTASASPAADNRSSEDEVDELPKSPPPPPTRRPTKLGSLSSPNNRSASVSRPLTVRTAQPKKKRKREEKKQDKKAAKTLSAILLAFIITWTPYNVLVLLRAVLKCQACIPKELWNFSYYLCYINSTVNPLCYALCNASFRRTYVKILTCTWQRVKLNSAHLALNK